jgi:hypothetical protein
VERAVRVAHIDQLDRWQPQAVHALAQVERPHRQPALWPRRGASADQDRARQLCPALRDAPRVVTWISFLLVGRIVLLVDYDQPRIA